MVSLYFSVTYSFRPYHDPGVDSAPSENEYQEHFLGCGRCARLTTSPPSCAECHEILEPKPSGTLWTTPGLLRDCFTFFLLHIDQQFFPFVRYNMWVISKVLHTVPFLFKNHFILQNTFTGLQCNLYCALSQRSNVWARLVFLSGRLRC